MINSNNTDASDHAAKLLGEFGEDAHLRAERHMQEEMLAGNMNGANYWLSVMYEITCQLSKRVS